MKRLKNWFFTVTATTNTKGKRFLKYDQPVEDTYRDLIDSVPFFNETEDRAKIDSQGLVHKATNQEAKEYNETELTIKTKAVVPSQLPEVKSVSQTISPTPFTLLYQENIIETNIANNDTEDINYDKRNVFILSISQSFIDWLTGSFSAISNTISDIYNTISTTISNLNLNGGTTGQYLRKNSNIDNDYSWVSSTFEGYVVINCNNTNQIDRVAFPFNVNISVETNIGVTINNPTFPLVLTANTILTIDTTATNGVLTLKVVEI